MAIKVLIKLQKPSRAYFTGETIFGSVVIKNETATSYPLARDRQMVITFRGGASTNLYGQPLISHAGLADLQRAITPVVNGVIGRESYLEHAFALTPGEDEDGRPVSIVPGTNGFPFQFELPTNLATSFGGSSHGRVQYYAMVVVYLEGIPTYFAARTDFSVINMLDLNLHPSASQKAYFSFEKVVWITGSRNSMRRRDSSGSSSSSSTSGYKLVNVVVKVPKEGYITGEVVELSLQLLNCVSREFKQVEVELVQDIGYSCPAGHFNESRLINSVVIECSEQMNVSEIGCPIEISAGLVPSTPANVTLIRISYCILIKLKLAHSGGTVDIGKIPITIGTVALRQIGWYNNSAQAQRASGAGAIGGPGSASSSTTTPNASPSRSPESRRMQEYRQWILEFMNGEGVVTTTNPSAPRLASIEADLQEGEEDEAVTVAVEEVDATEASPAAPDGDEDELPPTYNEVMEMGLSVN